MNKTKKQEDKRIVYAYARVATKEQLVEHKRKRLSKRLKDALKCILR